MSTPHPSRTALRGQKRTIREIPRYVTDDERPATEAGASKSASSRPASTDRAATRH